MIDSRGRLAQLVARFVHTEEVIGSSPVSPTLRQVRDHPDLGPFAFPAVYDERMTQPALRRPRFPARFFGGVRLLGAGLRMWITDPRIMLLGAIPALIVTAVYVGGIVLLAGHLDGLAAAATPFADGWDEGTRTVVRAAVTLAILAAALLIFVYTFTTVTLAIGSPFYERISRKVEDRLGGIDSPVELPFWKGLGRGILDGLRVLVTTLGVALVLLVTGFIPVVGQTLVPVLGAVAGGWLLALELSAFAFEARGYTGTAKRRALSTDRATTLGLGIPTYLLFFIPLAAVVVMPAAVAGGTMLARRSVVGAATTTPAG